MYCVNMVSVMVMVVSIVSVVLGQSTRENEEMDFEDMGTVEGFIKTKEFRVSFIPASPTYSQPLMKLLLNV